MGGKALKIAKTERCDNDKYISLSKILIPILKGHFDNVSVVRNYTYKETHGDIDIICGTTNNINYHDLITELFNPVEIFHNDNCHSFDFDKTQIDLIVCKNEDYDSYLHYYDYGLGNYLGKIAQSVGLKYGSNGLFYNYYIGGNKKYKIIISKDFRKIFNFLGYDYNTFINGFATIEEIYHYVTTSKYFIPKIFKIENLSKVNRGRDVRREVYMNFLEYIENLGPSDDFNEKEVLKLKSTPIETISDFFPEANIDFKLKEINHLFHRKLYVSAKFNGGMVIKRYGIEGKELGEALKHFKYCVSTMFEFYNYDEFIVRTSEKDIWDLFEASLDSE